MNTYEERLASWEAELREKYSDDDRKQMAKEGSAMPDGSFPIKDEEDLDNAIHAVGRGGSSHDAIRKHIMKRAEALGLSSKIPDNWQADGSLKQENAALVKGAERRKKARHRAVPLGREVRFFSPTQVEVREQDTDTPEIVISGAAIIWGASYRVVDHFGEFRETIHAGSAADILNRGMDCRLLLNHGGLPMARTTSGTMEVFDSPDALRFTATLDRRQQLANDFSIAIQRNDLTGVSVGMIVGRDAWGWDDDTETRDIYGLEDLIDVSGVTFPCSPTTHLEVAQRMAFSMPMESRARLRKMEVELRAGKVLSADSQTKLVTALSALHDLANAGGIDPQDIVPGDSEASDDTVGRDDGSAGTSSSESGAGITYPDGSGLRTAPATAAERREQSMSYNDRQSAVYEALLSKLGDGDGDCDLWICDLSDDWVVWQSYLDPMGLFRCAYGCDNDGQVTLLGDPEPVRQETSYVPAERDDSEASVGMKASTLRLLVEAGRAS